MPDPQKHLLLAEDEGGEPIASAGDASCTSCRPMTEVADRSRDARFAGLLSVVIPALNEAHRLPLTIAAIHDWLSARGVSFEILVVVDDGTTDRTGATVREHQVRYPNLRLLTLPNSGKGAAVKA